jgi:hypothetical protein
MHLERVDCITIKEIAHLYFSLKFLDLEKCENISKKAMDQLNSNIYIENFNKNYYCFNSKSFDFIGTQLI